MWNAFFVNEKLSFFVSDKVMRLYDTSTSNYKLIRKVNGIDVGWSIIDTAFSSKGDMIAYSSWSENGENKIERSICNRPQALRSTCSYF